MSFKDHEFLSTFGWSDFFERQFSTEEKLELIPAKVICEERGLYRLQVTSQHSLWASIRGKMQFDATGREDFPAVGDWVFVEIPEQGDRGVIHEIAPRKTTLQRKQIGTGSDLQILATNVDYVFITSSLNDDLNLRRFERYLVVAWESGCIPVILLTKADLYQGDLESLIPDLESQLPGVPIHTVTREDFMQAEFFQEYLQAGKTCAVLGSSGVGKSTLVNYLIGGDRIRTQDIRESDSKGKHTTTSRSLYVTRFGGLIIDTPGMRELQLSDHAEGVQTQFADIENLTEQCRFRDCQHQTEPGCAIQNALATGELAEERWRSFLKLAAEIRFEMRKRDKALAAEDKKLWKKMQSQGRQNWKAKRGEGY